MKEIFKSASMIAGLVFLMVIAAILLAWNGIQIFLMMLIVIPVASIAAAVIKYLKS